MLMLVHASFRRHYFKFLHFEKSTFRHIFFYKIDQWQKGAMIVQKCKTLDQKLAKLLHFMTQPGGRSHRDRCTTYLYLKITPHRLRHRMQCFFLHIFDRASNLSLPTLGRRMSCTTVNCCEFLPAKLASSKLVIS